jgi:hypothetical protein
MSRKRKSCDNENNEVKDDDVLLQEMKDDEEKEEEEKENKVPLERVPGVWYPAKGTDGEVVVRFRIVPADEITEEEKKLGRWIQDDRLQDFHYPRTDVQIKKISLLVTDSKRFSPFNDVDFARYYEFVKPRGECEILDSKGESFLFNREKRLWQLQDHNQTRVYIQGILAQHFYLLEGKSNDIPLMPPYSVIYHQRSINAHLMNDTKMAGVLRYLAPKTMNKDFLDQLDNDPYIVSQCNLQVLDLRSLEVKDRTYDHYCSKQSASRYLRHHLQQDTGTYINGNKMLRVFQAFVDMPEMWSSYCYPVLDAFMFLLTPNAYEFVKTFQLDLFRRTHIMRYASNMMTGVKGDKLLSLCSHSGGGKSSLFKAIGNAVGKDYVLMTSSKHLLISGPQERASAHSSHLAAMVGKRGVLIDEIKKDDEIDSGNFRLLIGEADGIPYRPVGKSQCVLYPIAQMVMLHNHVPKGMNETFIERRTVAAGSDVVFYDAEYTETQRKFPLGLVKGQDFYDEKRKEMWKVSTPERLTFKTMMGVSEDDASDGHRNELFTMVANYAHFNYVLESHRQKIDPPPIIREDLKRLFSSQDALHEFLEENFKEPETDLQKKHCSSFKDVYDAYVKTNPSYKDRLSQSAMREKLLNWRYMESIRSRKTLLLSIHWLNSISADELIQLQSQTQEEKVPVNDDDDDGHDKKEQKQSGFSEGCHNLLALLHKTIKEEVPNRLDAYEQWLRDNQCHRTILTGRVPLWDDQTLS